MTLNPTVIHRLDRWAASLRDLAPVLRGETASVTIDDIRRSYDRTMAEHPTPADMRIEQVDMGGVPATLVTPPGVAGDRAMQCHRARSRPRCAGHTSVSALHAEV